MRRPATTVLAALSFVVAVPTLPTVAQSLLATRTGTLPNARELVGSEIAL